MSLYVATYDISDDRRRTQVSRVLLQYGTRLQRSVFEVWLEPAELDCHVADRFQRGPGCRWSTGSSWPLSDAAPRGGPAETPRPRRRCGCARGG